ncbi:MAG: hypothetical protein FD170_2863 [Bacteroidetes bacterium]|nr:MAG: hypothetical protein FD170_2863 [Bacteroidota bacterium]
MRKHNKPAKSEIADSVVLNNVNEDEAETERFIKRLELQRKLLLNFIEPAANNSGKMPENGNVNPERKSGK